MTHRYTAPLALALLTPATLAWAQGASAATPATDPAWRHCAAQPDSAARLACLTNGQASKPGKHRPHRPVPRPLACPAQRPPARSHPH